MFLRAKQQHVSRRIASEADQNTIPVENMHGIEAQYKCNESDQSETTKNPFTTVKKQKKDEEMQKTKSQTQREKKPKCSERFDGLHHWPDFDDPNGPRKGYRCKHCGAQSDVYCCKCNVQLCFVKEKTKKGQEQRKVRNCFKAFHTHKKF